MDAIHFSEISCVALLLRISYSLFSNSFQSLSSMHDTTVMKHAWFQLAYTHSFSTNIIASNNMIVEGALMGDGS
jgi:hypothetical protein